MWGVSGIWVSGWVLFSPYREALTNNGYNSKFVGRWSDPSSFNLSHVVLRWGVGPGTEGLGGSITWAVDASFCERLLPHFPEAQMSRTLRIGNDIDCETLRAAIRSAFDTWSMNHGRISFHDVSSGCVGASVCDAEVVLSVTQSDDSTVAYVQPNLRNLNWYPRTTAGDVVRGIGLRSAEMHVSNDVCWYLDATFCAHIHRLDVVGEWSVIVVRLSFLITLVLSTLPVADAILGAIFAAYGKRRSTLFFRPPPRIKSVASLSSSRAHVLLRVSAHVTRLPMVGLVLCVFLMMFTPIFYVYVFVPCWDCYDFEATVAHEVGHILGFHHPDEFDTLNLRATRPMGTSVCHNAFGHVGLAPVRETNTLMHSRTRHFDRTCLTMDDVEGLAFLYPTCEPTIEPLCAKTQRLDGVIRLFLSASIPWIITMGVLVVVQTCARRHYTQEVRRLEKEVRELHEDNRRQSVLHRCSNLILRASVQARNSGRYLGVTRRLGGTRRVGKGEGTKRLGRAEVTRRVRSVFTSRVPTRSAPHRV